MNNESETNKQHVSEKRNRETPTLYGLLNSYRELPKNATTNLHEAHHRAMRTVLQDAISAYGSEMETAMAQSLVSDYQLEKINKNFDHIVQGARHIPFPSDVLTDLSTTFIDHSLDYTIPLTPFEREASAEIALAIGDETISTEKIRRVIAHEIDALKSMKEDNSTQVQADRAKLAYAMLHELGIDVTLEQTPSLSDTVTNFTRHHARSVATTGVAAVVAASVLAPSAANAATSIESGDPTVTVSAPSPHQPSQFSITSPVAPTQPATIDISAALPSVSSTETIKSITVTATPDVPNVIVSPADIPKTAKTPDSPIPIDVTSSTAEISAVPSAASSEVGIGQTATTVIPVVNAGASQQQELVTSVQAAPISPSVGTPDSTSTPQSLTVEAASDTSDSTKEAPLSSEQKTIQTITNTINNDGDVSTAASLIKLAFRSKTEVATSFSNGKPVYGTTNPDLVKNVHALEISVEKTISAAGHTNVNYVNTALMALAVLDAAANDQTVLQSPDVQSLLTGVTRPTDEYQGKLFDQYLAQAQKTLTANNSALLSGINSQYVSQVETVYAYALMASASDTEQATQIQTIKNQEAAAAAAAQEQAGGGSASAEALQNLINSAPDTWHKNSYIALQFFINKGLSPVQATGLLGNLERESASTMDPAIQQEDGGPGFGIAQWTSYGDYTGRYDGLVSYAASIGQPTTSLSVQLNYIWIELTNNPGFGLAQLKAATTVYDAANAVMVHYETPEVVLDGSDDAIAAEAQTRASRGQPFLDAYNQEVSTVTAQQEAAAAAAAQAAAEKAAEQSKAQKLVAAAQAELAKWQNGQYKPLDNNGASNYLAYTNGTHTNWCADFVSYLLNEIGSPVPGANGSASHAVVPDLKEALLSTGDYTWHAAGSYTPQPGDIAFYGGYDHVNIVVSGNSPTNFDTIGGNEGNDTTPAYAASYGGQSADNAAGNSYDNSYVAQEPGSWFNSSDGLAPDGFLSPNS